MNGGDIVEQGTHDELMAKGGFYANLYNSQFANFARSLKIFPFFAFWGLRLPARGSFLCAGNAEFSKNDAFFTDSL